MSYTKTTWVNNTTPIDENNLNKIESGIKNNDINIGEENYDNTKTYEVGDIVRYNEKIYKCITAITTAENFDISKWEQTNIVEIVQSEKSKIYELIEAISTPIVGEGENITLNDTAEKRFENFDIEGNSEQETRSGKNLLPNEFEQGASDGKGNKTRLFNYSNIQLNTNTVYTFSTNLDITKYKYAINIASIKYPNTDNSKTLYNSGWQNAKQSYTFTTPEKNGYLGIAISTKNGTDDINLNSLAGVWFQVEKNSIATPYEQYGASPSPDYPSEVKSCGDNGSINEVICNKNLWNINYSGTKQAITYNLSKNKITLNGTSNGLGDVFNTKNHSTFFLKAGTYTINVKVISGSFTAGTNDMALYFKKKSDEKNFVSLYKGINYTAKGTITFTEDDEVYVYSFVNGSNVIFNNLVIEIQMEEGSTETDCVEHQEQVFTIPTQQPMRSIGDTRDKFILKENGKWYERHFIARKIFDGTETFTIETRGEVTNFYTSVEGFGSQKGYCNILPVKIDSSYTANILFIWANLKGISMMFEKSRFSTVSDYQAYLAEQYNAGTPVYVDYVLEEPLDIECTSEQTEILNQIYIKAKSYKGITHIYSNDEVSPNCYVEAVKDLTTLIQ